MIWDSIPQKTRQRAFSANIFLKNDFHQEKINLNLQNAQSWWIFSSRHLYITGGYNPQKRIAGIKKKGGLAVFQMSCFSGSSQLQ